MACGGNRIHQAEDAVFARARAREPRHQPKTGAQETSTAYRMSCIRVISWPPIKFRSRIANFDLFFVQLISSRLQSRRKDKFEIRNPNSKLKFLFIAQRD